jgi:flagellar protein FlaG
MSVEKIGAGRVPEAGARHPPSGRRMPEAVQAAAPPPENALARAAEEIRAALAARELGLRFVTDRASGRVLVQIVDAATSEVVRQIPPEEMLALARALDALQGALVRARA